MRNIIRTTAVELTTIPAIAYKQKLSSGGSGIKIFRLDRPAHEVFTIDRRTGEGVPYGKNDSKLFPDEAVSEAIELTMGLPYTGRGKLKVSHVEEDDKKDEEDVEETEIEKIDMVHSDEYEAIIQRYSDEKGHLNYSLMNKDFMQFANKSKTVSTMVADKASKEDILNFVVKSRAAFLSGKKESLSEDETEALIETLDEINPRSAFKELKAFIKRLLSKGR